MTLTLINDLAENQQIPTEDITQWMESNKEVDLETLLKTATDFRALPNKMKTKKKKIQRGKRRKHQQIINNNQRTEKEIFTYNILNTPADSRLPTIMKKLQPLIEESCEQVEAHRVAEWLLDKEKKQNSDLIDMLFNKELCKKVVNETKKKILRHIKAKKMSNAVMNIVDEDEREEKEQPTEDREVEEEEKEKPRREEKPRRRQQPTGDTPQKQQPAGSADRRKQIDEDPRYRTSNRMQTFEESPEPHSTYLEAPTYPEDKTSYKYKAKQNTNTLPQRGLEVVPPKEEPDEQTLYIAESCSSLLYKWMCEREYLERFTIQRIEQRTGLELPPSPTRFDLFLLEQGLDVQPNRENYDMIGYFIDIFLYFTNGDRRRHDTQIQIQIIKECLQQQLTFDILFKRLLQHKNVYELNEEGMSRMMIFFNEIYESTQIILEETPVEEHHKWHPNTIQYLLFKTICHKYMIPRLTNRRNPQKGSKDWWRRNNNQMKKRLQKDENEGIEAVWIPNIVRGLYKYIRKHALLINQSATTCYDRWTGILQEYLKNPEKITNMKLEPLQPKVYIKNLLEDIDCKRHYQTLRPNVRRERDRLAGTNINVHVQVRLSREEKEKFLQSKILKDFYQQAAARLTKNTPWHNKKESVIKVMEAAITLDPAAQTRRQTTKEYEAYLADHVEVQKLLRQFKEETTRKTALKFVHIIVIMGRTLDQIKSHMMYKRRCNGYWSYIVDQLCNHVLDIVRNFSGGFVKAITNSRFNRWNDSNQREQLIAEIEQLLYHMDNTVLKPCTKRKETERNMKKIKQILSTPNSQRPHSCSRPLTDYPDCHSQIQNHYHLDEPPRNRYKNHSRPSTANSNRSYNNTTQTFNSNQQEEQTPDRRQNNRRIYRPQQQINQQSYYQEDRQQRNPYFQHRRDEYTNNSPRYQGGYNNSNNYQDNSSPDNQTRRYNTRYDERRRRHRWTNNNRERRQRNYEEYDDESESYTFSTGRYY